MQTSTQSSQTFLLRTDRGVKVIVLENLVRIEAISNYSKLHFADGKMLVVARVLRRFEEELAESGFVRVHHKHLVSICWLNALRSKSENVCHVNGHTIVLSRRKRKAVNAALKKWCEERTNQRL